MLKKYFFIIFIIFFVPIFLGQENSKADVQLFEDAILQRAKRIESLYPNVIVKWNKQSKLIEVRHNNKLIREFSIQKETDLSIQKIISFFLNLEETLLFINSLKNESPFNLSRIEIIEALYEYPFIDETGTFFVYISDKGTGNRNAFILNLVSYKEKEIIIPETGDYFPILMDNTIYFLMAVEEGFSLMSYYLEDETMKEITRGNINCLRKYSNHIFYSKDKSIFKIDSSGKLIERFDFKKRIQSFDIQNNLIVLSMLNEIQYDLYLYNIHFNSIEQLTNTDFNEVDSIFKNLQTIIYVSNKNGNYGLYSQSIDHNFDKNIGQLLYQRNNEEVYNPFYTEIYSKIICSVYQSGKEPKFLIIPD